MGSPLPQIHAQADRCLRRRGADCEQCVALCPVGAIVVNPAVQLDPALCAQCGACLHACPTHVFSRLPDEFDSLMQMVGPRAPAGNIELVCANHTSPDIGFPECDSAFKTESCLAALGPSAYLTLFALGVTQIIPRLDNCPNCPRGLQNAEQIIRNICSFVACMLESYRPEIHIEIAASPPVNPTKRPIFSTRDTSISRRRLLGSLLGQRAEWPLEKLADLSERERLMETLEKLAGCMDTCDSTFSNLPFFDAAIDDQCNACLACVRACPSGALTGGFPMDDRFQLDFTPGLCLDCKLCLAACRQAAIERTPLDKAGNPGAWNRHVIYEGGVRFCGRCRTKFRSSETQSLCPACAFRRQNPFGAITAPPFKGQSS